MDPRPVRRVEVDQKHVVLRIVLLVLCLLVAAFALGNGISLLFSKQAGWHTVEANVNERNCSPDFTLKYYLEDRMDAAYRQVTSVYSQACVEAYGYFNVDGELGTILPNTSVTISAPLYQALEQVQAAGNRCIYLAPVYNEYQRIFLCDNEVEAALYDPATDPSLAQELAQLAQWCNDPEMIDLQLLGNNTVELKVSGAYLQYTQEYEQEEFLDFGWIKNAFVADYIAQKLIDSGFTRGYLVSYDGYTRNLDDSGEQFSLNVFDRQGNAIEKPAVLTYTGPMSIVSLRNYPMTEQDRWQYFTFQSGRIVTACIDPADGVSKSSLHNLIVYGASDGCAQLVLKAAPVYLSDVFDASALQTLAQENVYSIWSEGKTLYCTDPAMPLEMLESTYTCQSK